MARIFSKTALTKYIKSQLGSPQINIEVNTSQMSEIIDNTVQLFTEYAYGTLEGAVVVQINGVGDYPMPNTITNLIKLSKGSTSNLTNFSSNFGAGYVPDLWSQQFFSGSLTGDIIPSIIAISSTSALLDKYFADDLVYNFNYLSKNLQVLENFHGPAVLHYQYEYLANEANDLVYDHPWIKAYCISKTKFLWGGITGKYSQTLVGGASINYSDMKSEAQSEIDVLDEQLINKYSDPCPIDVA